MRATRVSPSNGGLVWREVEPYLDSALSLEMCDDDPQQIKTEIFNGLCQLWIINDAGVIKAAGVTRIVRDTCFCVALGGRDLSEWVEILDREASSFAKKFGCKRIRVTGRPGWKKIMKPLGYSEPFVVVQKVL